VLPVVLAPAALVVLAPPSAVQGPAIHGLVVNQAGKPLPATLGLVPMSQREELFPSKTVENRTARTRKAGPGFELRAPAPGLYLLDVRGRGCRPFQVPVLLGEEGLQDLRLAPVPVKLKGEAQTLSPDARLAALAGLYAAQRDRESNYQKAIKARLADKGGNPGKGSPLDWTADLDALAKEVKDGAEPELQALAAACYLELCTMMAEGDPATIGAALDLLPATSPWWALSPRSARGAFTAADRTGEWGAFVETLSKDNPDREVRAYGIYSQAASAYRKGDREKFGTLSRILANDYKGTKYARSAKVLDPARMPPPTAASAEEVPPAQP